MSKGIFTISLDFELYWGVRDKRTLTEYGPNILGVREAIPRMLELFAHYGLHATWATVGFLFFDGKEELIESLPSVLPKYSNRNLSPYLALEKLGKDEASDPYHFAPSLIHRIVEAPNQEIGTHTFSHYYCLENGQEGEAFRADLQSAVEVANRKFGIGLKSLVFPRNQFNSDYLQIAAEVGIRAYRGNECSWIYAAKNAKAETSARRILRLADSYVSLTGHNTYPIALASQPSIRNLPASRFLRPYSTWFRPLERFRLLRILSDLSYAARTGRVFHLWWHPHNFGRHLDENLFFLRAISEHFARLRDSHGFKSRSMGGMAEELSQ